MPRSKQLNVGDYVRVLSNIKDSAVSNDAMKNCVNYIGRIVRNYSEHYYQLELLSLENNIQKINTDAFSWCDDWLEPINPPQFKVGEKVKSNRPTFNEIYEIVKLKFNNDILLYDLSDGKGRFFLSFERNIQKLMESKYKVGQVVKIADDIDQFNEYDHRYLTNVMREAYSDLALIVDVKPAEGITDSKDDGFNYSIKFLDEHYYTEECEEEIWTSELFDDGVTPIFKIDDLVHFTDNDQWNTKTVYRVDSYYKDEDDDGNLALGYYLVSVIDSHDNYYTDASEIKYLELVNTEQVDVTNSSLEGKLCCVKSDADIIADYNTADIEFTKQQIIKLQQKVEENENRLRKSEKSITGSGRPGELGILNRGNQTRLRKSEASIAAFSIDSRKRVGFFED